MVADLVDGIGQDRLRKQGATVKSAVADLVKRLRKGDCGKRAASVKGVRKKSCDAVGDRERTKGAILVKGGGAKGGESVGKGERGKGGAERKCPFTDRFDAGRKTDTLKRGAVGEGVASDRLYAVGQNDLFETGEIRKGKGCYGVNAVGNRDTFFVAVIPLQNAVFNVQKRTDAFQKGIGVVARGIELVTGTAVIGRVFADDSAVGIENEMPILAVFRHAAPRKVLSGHQKTFKSTVSEKIPIGRIAYGIVTYHRGAVHIVGTKAVAAFLNVIDHIFVIARAAVGETVAAQLTKERKPFVFTWLDPTSAFGQPLYVISVGTKLEKLCVCAKSKISVVCHHTTSVFGAVNAVCQYASYSIPL